MTDNVSDKVKRIIAEQAMVEPDVIGDATTMEDLGLDSLALVEVVFAIEEEFDIQVPFNANEPTESDFDISNVRSIVAGIEKLIAEQKA